ncbi:MAG: DUF1844 domain-containing protein [Candidatus Omnitrophica bacterium]|nr:DUF1844 domain-containing protein [Candidatus Omnitrophota bacterium]
MNEDVKKKVDENWKNQIEKEKEDSQERNQEFHQPNFTVLVSSLSMQAMISLGKLENPLTNKKEENLEQARFLIDTLDILKEKTKGNLTGEETVFLDDSLYHLRLIYVEKKNLKDKGL